MGPQGRLYLEQAKRCGIGPESERRRQDLVCLFIAAHHIQGLGKAKIAERRQRPHVSRPLIFLDCLLHSADRGKEIPICLTFAAAFSRAYTYRLLEQRFTVCKSVKRQEPRKSHIAFWVLAIEFHRLACRGFSFLA